MGKQWCWYLAKQILRAVFQLLTYEFASIIIATKGRQYGGEETYFSPSIKEGSTSESLRVSQYIILGKISQHDKSVGQELSWLIDACIIGAAHVYL